jgi:hypothetical protein
VFVSVFLPPLTWTLNRGERHEYAVIYRVPMGQPMRTHYVLAPMQYCDMFELRVRFNPYDLPKAVWRVEHVTHRDLDGPCTASIERF